MGLLITACGVPVYLLCIRWKDKPSWVLRSLHKLGYTSQKMFLGVKEDKDITCARHRPEVEQLQFVVVILQCVPLPGQASEEGDSRLRG